MYTIKATEAHHGHGLVRVYGPLEGVGVLVEDGGQVTAELGHEVLGELVAGEVGQHLDDRHLGFVFESVLSVESSDFSYCNVLETNFPIQFCLLFQH